jgi:hypothetical protein
MTRYKVTLVLTEDDPDFYENPYDEESLRDYIRTMGGEFPLWLEEESVTVERLDDEGRGEVA